MSRKAGSNGDIWTVIDKFTSIDNLLRKQNELLERQQQLLEKLAGKQAPTIKEANLEMPTTKLEMFLRQSRDMQVLLGWNDFIRELYELTTHISADGILIEQDVDPNSTYTKTIDLTGKDYCCISSWFMACCDLGAYGKLTILVNERSQVAGSGIIAQHPEWLEKYSVRPDTPLSTDIGVHHFVNFPKKFLRITFNNTHSSDTAHFVLFTSFLATEDKTAEAALSALSSSYVKTVEGLVLQRKA